MKHLFMVICLLLSGTSVGHIKETLDDDLPEKPFVVIIPSYKNIKWYQWNLDSVFAQRYQNFRVMYIDDCSPDGTGKNVQRYVAEKGWSDRVQVIRNKERRGALYNLYYAIHSCLDYEIVINLDGDDAFAHVDVLKRMNREYQNSQVWLTYGQFIEVPQGRVGYCSALPPEALSDKIIRQYACCTSAPRTFYAGLFKKIKKEDLMYEGEFFEMTWDRLMMAFMLEMAVERHRFIPDILYIYNRYNPISDQYKNERFQTYLAKVVDSMPSYKRLPDNQVSWINHD